MDCPEQVTVETRALGYTPLARNLSCRPPVGWRERFGVPIIRLHYERIKRRWTQAELGRRAGIRQTDVSAIERGRLNPTDDELLRLANALLISPPSVLMKPTSLPDERRRKR